MRRLCYTEIENNTEYIVLKNNQPTASLISPKEYKETQEKAEKFEKLQETIESIRLLQLAESRKSSKSVSFESFVAEAETDGQCEGPFRKYLKRVGKVRFGIHES